MLLSVHLASKFPGKFTALLDNIEATIADPSRIEVLVKIDSEDAAMNALLPREAARRPFAVRFISTPRGEGYFGLWSAYNDLLKIAHPEAYFVSVMNDEVKFVTRGWDETLQGYVGFYPDHLFRLRISQYRLRNYIDFWECGYAPDAYALYTRRWFEISGDWCPCNTPDAFQQSVAFYLWGATRPGPGNRQYNRDIPVHDIQLEGEAPYQGLSDEELRERVRVAEAHWFRLMSWTIQTEASLRAHRLLAYARASELGLAGYSIEADVPARRVRLIERPSGRELGCWSYALSRVRIGATNFWRKPLFEYWCGGSRAIIALHLRHRYARHIDRYERLKAWLRRWRWYFGRLMRGDARGGASDSAPGLDSVRLVDGSFDPWGSTETADDTVFFMTRAVPFRARAVIVNLFSPGGRAHLREVRVAATNVIGGRPGPWTFFPARLRETDVPLPFSERVVVPPDRDFARVTIEIDRAAPGYDAFDTWGLACLSRSKGDRRNWLAEGNGIYVRRLVVT